MKKVLILTMLLGIMEMSMAARFFPKDMDVAVLQDYQQRQVVLSPDGFSWIKIFTLGWLDKSRVFDLTAGVKVRDDNNRFITYGRLSSHKGKVVAVKRDSNNGIDEIWILSDRERDQFRQLAKQRDANQ